MLLGDANQGQEAVVLPFPPRGRFVKREETLPMRDATIAPGSTAPEAPPEFARGPALGFERQANGSARAISDWRLFDAEPGLVLVGRALGYPRLGDEHGWVLRRLTAMNWENGIAVDEIGTTWVLDEADALRPGPLPIAVDALLWMFTHRCQPDNARGVALSA